jgi:hypothetical protein
MHKYLKALSPVFAGILAGALLVVPITAVADGAVAAKTSIVELACTSRSDKTTFHVTFNLRARTATIDGKTYSAQITDATVKWQWVSAPPATTVYNVYNRDTAQLERSHSAGTDPSTGTYWTAWDDIADCVRGQRVF